MNKGVSLVEMLEANDFDLNKVKKESTDEYKLSENIPLVINFIDA